MDAHRTAAPPLPNSWWVLPGRLLAGDYPGGASAEITAARLARLLDSGVRSFIDLTSAEEVAPYDAQLPPGIDYRRMSVPDHGVPDTPGQMAQTLLCLRQAFEAGRIVYLHCRAGIGRTTMVAGCLLVERGLPGPEALRELNRRWQQCARAQQWPQVPETEEQADYVRDWLPSAEGTRDPLLAAETLAAARGLRARFHGALLGLAVGDAVAAATQFARPGRFAPVGDLLGGGPFDLPRGGWSDDTAMALCLADSLLACEGFDSRDQIERYRRWREHGYLSATEQCLGITAATSRALALAHWRRQPFTGSHDPTAQDPEVLSRVVAAVLFYFAQAAEVPRQAAEAARTTCQAPLALAACAALAVGLHAALSGQPKTAITAAIAAALGGADPGRSETAPGALAAALEIFAGTQSFRDAVLQAANLGGNSDVVGAVVGALAGAHYSADAIPTMWRNSLMKQQLLADYADRLLAHAVLELGA